MFKKPGSEMDDSGKMDFKVARKSRPFDVVVLRQSVSWIVSVSDFIYLRNLKGTVGFDFFK
jgi:hypothetical protein